MENIIKYTFNFYCPLNVKVILSIFNDQLKVWDNKNDVEFKNIKKNLYILSLNLSLNKTYQYKYLLNYNNAKINIESLHIITKEELLELKKYSNLRKKDTDNLTYIMSFNLRYLNKKDYSTHLNWHNRKQLCVKVIQNYYPDFIGYQEAKPNQISYLYQNLHIYAYIGRSRSNKEGDEQCGIMYLRNKYICLNYNSFWLSDTPDVIGSNTWGNGGNHPRLVTWGKFYSIENDKIIYIFNTHFDHVSPTIRYKSSLCLSKKINEIILMDEDCYNLEKIMFLTGDFNCTIKEEAIKHLSNKFKATCIEKNNYESTFHNKGNPGNLIDYIFYKTYGKNFNDYNNYKESKLECIEYKVDKYNENNLYPSDHFPIISIFKY